MCCRKGRENGRNVMKRYRCLRLQKEVVINIIELIDDGIKSLSIIHDLWSQVSKQMCYFQVTAMTHKKQEIIRVAIGKKILKFIFQSH